MIKRWLAGLGMLLLVAPVLAQDSKAPAVPPDAAAPAKVVAKKTAPVPGDEAGVKAAFDAFSKAWGAGDAHARAMVFTNDGSVINPFGQEAWGRQELEKLFNQENATIGKGTTHVFDHFRMTFVMPTLALVDCDGTISGIKTPAGTDAPDQKLHVFVVAVKRGTNWQIRFARPAIFAALPGSEPAAAAPAMPEAKTDKKDEKK
jgi:uncharacterized protein (TIGR02246 family)